MSRSMKRRLAAAGVHTPLCFRCEHRARFLEDQLAGEKHCRRPRCECGDVSTARYSCYQFRPVSPVVLARLKPTEEDPRPRFAGAMLSCREKGVRVFNARIDAKVIDEKRAEVLLYCLPEEDPAE